MLLRLAADVDLHEHGGARCPLGDLVARRDTIDRLPEADERGDLAHVVALDVRQVVPAKIVTTGEGRRFGHQLLRSVLAHIDEAVAGCCLHGVGAEVLGDGDECDLPPVAAGAGDPLTNLGQAVR